MRTLATDATADQLLDYLASDGNGNAWTYFVGRLARILAARGLAQTRRAAMGMQLRLTPAGIALASEREREAVGALASIGNLHWLQPS